MFLPFICFLFAAQHRPRKATETAPYGQILTLSAVPLRAPQIVLCATHDLLHIASRNIKARQACDLSSLLYRCDVNRTVVCQSETHGTIINYFVPNRRSPASPSPGRIYPFSLRHLSSTATNICTSGCAVASRSTPSGAAMIDI